MIKASFRITIAMEVPFSYTQLGSLYYEFHTQMDSQQNWFDSKKKTQQTQKSDETQTRSATLTRT